MADETDSQRIISGQLVFNVSDMMNQLKQLSDTVDQVKRQMVQKPQGTVFLEEFGGSIQTAILQIENAARRSQISLDDLQKKLMDVQTAYRAAGAFDPNVVGSRNAAFNDKSVIDAANRVQQQQKLIYNQQVSDQKQMLNDWMSAQDKYYKDTEAMDKLHFQALQQDAKQSVTERQTVEKEYSSWWSTALKERDMLDKAYYQALQQDAKLSAAERQATEKEYNSWWSITLKEQEALDKTHYQALQEDSKRDASMQQQTIDGQMQRIKAFYDLKLSTAQESLTKIEQLMNDETTYFQQNQDKRIQSLKAAYQMENDIAAQEAANSKLAQMQNAKSSSSSGSGMRMNGFGMMNPASMASMMVEFTAMNGLINNLSQGFVAIDKSAAGLKQVFTDNVDTQQKLNTATNDFIGIAQTYGTSIQDVMDAAKLWGKRQTCPLAS